MTQNVASVVGSDIHTVLNTEATSGTNLAGTMNVLGNVIMNDYDNEPIVYTTGTSIGGTMEQFEKTVNTMKNYNSSLKESFVTTPSNYVSKDYTTPPGFNYYFNEANPSYQTNNSYEKSYGKSSTIYEKVKQNNTYYNQNNQPVRTGIPSPSGPVFTGVNGIYGNEPGAQGGPKMDPYSYFGNIPAKGWQTEPKPFSF